tara:strand:+ start:48 stop:1217 length:1170 start_codon:yes stop_codon:yes gene_type:complete
MFWSCSENPLQENLNHSNLNLDTLSIYGINAINYWVAPNIGSNDKLYLGKKNNFHIPYSFIEIENSIYWNNNYDSTVQIDSIRFILYSDDSLLTQNVRPSLYFTSDSIFNEYLSTYLDYLDLSNTGWFDIGEPRFNNVLDTTDNYMYSELIWDIDTLLQALTDTLDSNLVRSFILQNTNSDSSFLEFFSEEASTGETDPKIIMYYKQTYTSGDSIIIDTLTNTIYSNGDLSIIDPRGINNIANMIGISNGSGMRSIIEIPFNENSLPDGALLRNAKLILPYDTSLSPIAQNIIIDPLESDSVDIDSIEIYDIDPVVGIGFPYRVDSEPKNSLYILPIKNILQNITLGNEVNWGFKLLSNEKNDPFEHIWFDFNQNSNQARLEIIYAENQ